MRDPHDSIVSEPVQLEYHVSRQNYGRLYDAIRHVQFTYGQLYGYLVSWLQEIAGSLQRPAADVLGDLMEVSASTIYRWKSSSKHVETKHAERLSELMDLYLYGADVFGSRSVFMEWLVTPNVHLDRDAPLSRLDGTTGVKLVRHLLDKIEYGAPI